MAEDSEVDESSLKAILNAINALAERMDRHFDNLGEISQVNPAFTFESNASDNLAGDRRHEKALIRAQRPSLPDPRLLRRIIRHRQLRQRFFDDDLFADPSWDMLLDLAAARAEHARVSISSLCIASGVPSTTALRWINVLVGAGLLERADDAEDRRRAFVYLSNKGADLMARYFQTIGSSAEYLL